MATLQSKAINSPIATKDSKKDADLVLRHVLMVRFTSWANRNSSWNNAHRMHSFPEIGDHNAQIDNVWEALSVHDGS